MTANKPAKGHTPSETTLLAIRVQELADASHRKATATREELRAMPMSERRRVMSDARDHDRAATELFEAFAPLRAGLRAQFSNVDSSELESAFAHAWQEKVLATYTPRKGAFASWAHRLLRQAAINTAREQAGIDEVRSLDAIAVEPTITTESTLIDPLDAERAKTDVAVALAALPERDRAVVQSRLLDGLTRAAASTQLGISNSKLRTSEDRARTALREALAAWR